MASEMKHSKIIGDGRKRKCISRIRYLTSCEAANMPEELRLNMLIIESRNAVAHMEASHASGVIEGGFWADGEYIRGSISVDDLTTPTEGADSVSRRADLNCEPSGEPLQNGLKPEPSPSPEKGMV